MTGKPVAQVLMQMQTAHPFAPETVSSMAGTCTASSVFYFGELLILI
jgi:hypothetical protein